MLYHSAAFLFGMICMREERARETLHLDVPSHESRGATEWVVERMGSAARPDDCSGLRPTLVHIRNQSIVAADL